jgi:hypothetical protein
MRSRSPPVYSLKEERNTRTRADGPATVPATCPLGCDLFQTLDCGLEYAIIG